MKHKKRRKQKIKSKKTASKKKAKKPLMIFILLLITALALYSLSSGVSTKNPTLYCKFDDSVICEDGELPYAIFDYSFKKGKSGKALVMDEQINLGYQVEDNLNIPEGTIKFWIKPKWNGNDNMIYNLFFESSGNRVFENTIMIYKTNFNTLRFLIGEEDHLNTIDVDVSVWRANEWHHVVATWKNVNSGLANAEMRLYINGTESNQAIINQQIDIESVDDYFWIGNINLKSNLLFINPDVGFVNKLFANATIDELRIFDYAKTPKESS